MRTEQNSMNDSDNLAENEAFLRSLILARQIVSGWSDDVRVYNSIGFPTPHVSSVKVLNTAEGVSSDE